MVDNRNQTSREGKIGTRKGTFAKEHVCNVLSGS